MRVRDNGKILSTTRTTRIVHKEGDALQQIDDAAASNLLGQRSDSSIQVKSFRSVHVDKYRSCVDCLAKFPPGIQTKIVKCLRCNHRMRFEDCKVMVACRMTIIAADNKTSTLTAFSEVIGEILNVVDVSALSEDDIAEKLLDLKNLKLSFDNENVVKKIESQ